MIQQVEMLYIIYSIYLRLSIVRQLLSHAIWVNKNAELSQILVRDWETKLYLEDDQRKKTRNRKGSKGILSHVWWYFYLIRCSNIPYQVRLVFIDPYFCDKFVCVHLWVIMCRFLYSSKCVTEIVIVGVVIFEVIQ